MVLDILKALTVIGSGLGTVYDVRYEPRSENDDEREQVSENAHAATRKAVDFVSIFFCVVDAADAVLDIVFAANLIEMRERGYGALMIMMVFISAIPWVWSKKLLHVADKLLLDIVSRRVIIFLFESINFFIEDATTIFIFLQVPESYNKGNVAAKLNLVTTIICGVGVIIGLAAVLCCYTKNWCNSCSAFWANILSVFSLCWMGLYAMIIVSFAISIGTENWEGEDSGGPGAVYGVFTGFWIAAALLLLSVEIEPTGEMTLSLFA